MLQNNYHPNLQPRHGQNGIGNLEHDHIISYLNHNKKLNSGPTSEKERLEREKKQHRKKLRKRQKQQMIANVSGTRFEIVKKILESVGFTLRDDEVFKSCYLIWSDSFISQERITELKSYQRINHFMGMVEICRKDFLAKKFSKMQKLHPDDYNYFPKTWLFPQESNLLHKYIKESKNPNKKKYFILKPANGAMGMGIRLFSEDDMIKSNEPSIVQEYIDKPCLLNGYKNDFRIYVLITSCDPLRAFIYREGLVRFSTEKYVLHPNLKSDSIFMHLTNYSVNKKNCNYTRGTDEASGSKQSLSSLMNRFKEKFNINTDDLWKQITDIIVKTLLLVQPHLMHNYRLCRTGQLQSFDSVSFEILGFDILLDENLCPWLLEVNRSPSFGIDELLDRKVKSSLLQDTLRLINIKPGNKQKSIYYQKQKAQRRLTVAAARTRVEAHLDNEALKKRKDTEKRKQDLIDLLVRVQVASSREYFENRHVGNFSRIFPPDSKTHYDHYAELLVDSFTLFNQLNSQNNSSDSNQANQQMLQSFMLNQFREEDIMDQIKECEKEENQILEKFKLPQNAELTTIIPSVDFYESSSSEESTESDESESETISNATNDEIIGDYELLGAKQKGTKLSVNNENKSNYSSRASTARSFSSSKSHQSTVLSNHDPKPKGHCKPIASLKSKTISMSKIEANRSVKNKEAPTVNSHVNRILKIPLDQLEDINKIYQDDDCASHDSFSETHSLQKYAVSKSPIYDELLKILLTSLNTLTIRYPRQSDSETKSMLTKIYMNWDQYRYPVTTYWLARLGSRKREKVLEIVKNNVKTIVNDNFKYSGEIGATRFNRLLSKIYNRLLWNRGNGLMQCFTNMKSWQIILSSSGDQIKPIEIDIFNRIVQLCLDCVLIVYQFSISLSESGKSKSGTLYDSHSVVSNYQTSNFTNVFSVNSVDNLVMSP